MANLFGKTFNIPKIEPLDMQRVHIAADALCASSVSESMKKLEEALRMQQKEELEKKLEEQKNEEWIWIEGYKGTDKDMKCRDYQYELNKQFDMPEDSLIQDCSCGFHLCKDLKDVFGYYGLGKGIRFFKVSALVRKKDYEEYGNGNTGSLYTLYWSGISGKRDKLAAKSIIFLSECSADEVINAYVESYSSYSDMLEWSEEDKKEAMATSYSDVCSKARIKKLVELGYSEPLAKVLVKRYKYDDAVAAASQEDLSMDMRIAYILCND